MPAVCQDPGIARSPQRGLESSIYLPRKWTSVGALGGTCVRACALLNSDKISRVPTVCSPALGPLPLLDCVEPRKAETLEDVFTAVLNTFPIFWLNCMAALQGGRYYKEELRKGN